MTRRPPEASVGEVGARSSHSGHGPRDGRGSGGQGPVEEIESLFDFLPPGGTRKRIGVGRARPAHGGPLRSTRRPARVAASAHRWPGREGGKCSQGQCHRERQDSRETIEGRTHGVVHLRSLLVAGQPSHLCLRVLSSPSWLSGLLKIVGEGLVGLSVLRIDSQYSGEPGEAFFKLSVCCDHCQRSQRTAVSRGVSWARSLSRPPRAFWPPSSASRCSHSTHPVGVQVP